MCEIVEIPPPFSIETIGNGRARLMIFCNMEMQPIPFFNQYGSKVEGDVLKMDNVKLWYNDQFAKGCLV